MKHTSIHSKDTSGPFSQDEFQRANFRSVIKQLRDGIVLANDAGLIIEWNASLAQITGLAPEQVLGQLWYDVLFQCLPAESRTEAAYARIKAWHVQFLSTRSTRLPDLPKEEILQRPDGIRLLVEVSVFSIEADGVFMVCSIIRDITARKRAEEEIKSLNAELERRVAEQTAQLRESEVRYRSISELISDFAYCFRLELDGTMTPEWVTESVLRQYRISIDELADGCWRKLVHPDDLPILVEHGEILLSNQSHITQFRIVLRNGQVRWVCAYSKPIWDEAPRRVTRIIGAAQDVTEQKLADEARRESEARYRRMVETASEGIWVLNADGGTNFVNAELAKMLGYTVEAMLGRSLFDFMDAEARQVAREKLARRQEGLQEKYDFRFRRKDGTDLWAIVSATPIMDR